MIDWVFFDVGNVLFNDEMEDDISATVPVQLREPYASRIKKDRLSRLWEGIVRQKYVYDLERANSDEERAVYLLCSHRLEDACKTLLASRDFRLATEPPEARGNCNRERAGSRWMEE